MSEIKNEAKVNFGTPHYLPYEEWKRKRSRAKSPKNYPVRNGADVYKFMSESEELEKLEKEHSWILHVNTNKKITKKELYQIGTDSRIYIDIQEIFLRAMINKSRAFIFVHNHPNSCVEASQGDVRACISLRAASKICKIALLDFVIVGERDPGYVSFRDKGLFKDIDWIVRSRNRRNS